MSDEDLVRHAEDAYGAMRALNHGTCRTLPAPLVYDLLGNLNNVGYGLEQLLGQISTGLTRSLAEYDVYDRNRDPGASVALANDAMRTAALLAHDIGALLAAAQAAINLQGYNGRKHDPQGDRRACDDGQAATDRPTRRAGSDPRRD
jgi:hypothetical protein